MKKPINQLGLTEQSTINLVTSSVASVAAFIPGVGPLISIATSVIGSFFSSRSALKQLKRQLNRQLLIEYNNTVFRASLERLAPAIEQLVELGLQPGTSEFEQMLEHKLYAEIGYMANCNINLWNPGIPGQPNSRFLLARIDNKGFVTPMSPHVDINIGKIWLDICKKLKIEALKYWAEKQQDELNFQRQIQQEKEENKRQIITRVMITGGMALLLIGFMTRQKKKIEKLEAT